MRVNRLCTTLLVAVLTLGACSQAQDPEPAPTAPATAVEETTAPPTSSPTPTDAPTAASSSARFPECEPGEGKTVTMLEDVVVEAQEIPELRTDDVEIDGQTVPGIVVEGVSIPERVAERGCIIEYEAPGGCLPAMEISGAYIPAYTLPERVLPEVTLPDGTVLEEVVLPGVTVDEVVVDGVSVDQVCQLEEDPGSFVSAVFRDPIFRDPGFQDAAFQDPVFRDTVFLDDGETLPGVAVPGASAPGTSIPGESVPGAALEGYYLEGAEDVEVTSKDSEVYYSSEGDVLFGNNEDEILPEAQAALEAVVADFGGRGEPVKIRVEGHTDDVGSEEHNLDLSQRRADAVAAWLVEHGGVDAEIITTEGFGFEYPRADNGTEEGRAQNRRVVISVALG